MLVEGSSVLSCNFHRIEELRGLGGLCSSASIGAALQNQVAGFRAYMPRFSTTTTANSKVSGLRAWGRRATTRSLAEAEEASSPLKF